MVECFLFWGLGFKEDVFFYFKRGGGFVNMIKNKGLNRLLGILKDLRFDKIYFREFVFIKLFVLCLNIFKEYVKKCIVFVR